MTKLLRMFVLCIVAALGAVVLVSHGDAIAADDAVEKARELMDEGQTYFKAGRYKDAMEKFEAAYEAHAAGAFLYNAAFAAERAGDLQRAIYRYDMYLAADPNSPYGDQVRQKIDKLKTELSNVEKPSADGGGGAGGGDEAAGGAGGGATTPEKPKAPVPADEASIQQMYSLVRVVSQPAGAPLIVYERTTPSAAAFQVGAKNSGWRKILGGVKTPRDLSLKVGHYHVIVERFREFNRSQTDINLRPGHVYTFKANLSQGAFLGQLLFKTNVEQAKIYVDDPPPHKSAPMFRGPASVNLNEGPHDLWIETPGHEPVKKSFEITQGKTTEITVTMKRLEYGYLVLDGNAREIEVEINEQEHAAYLSQGEPLKIKLPAGAHKVVLDASGRKEYEGTIVVPKGQELPVHVNLVESYPRAKAVVMGLFAIGSAVGGVFLHLEAEKGIAPPDGTSADGHEPVAHDVFAVTRWVAFGTAGALAGLSIFFFIYDPNPDSFVKEDDTREFPEKKAKKAARLPTITPWVGPDAGGIGISGTF
jgi:hypothetical protein